MTHPLKLDPKMAFLREVSLSIANLNQNPQKFCWCLVWGQFMEVADADETNSVVSTISSAESSVASESGEFSEADSADLPELPEEIRRNFWETASGNVFWKAVLDALLECFLALVVFYLLSGRYERQPNFRCYRRRTIGMFFHRWIRAVFRYKPTSSRPVKQNLCAKSRMQSRSTTSWSS